MPPVSGRIQVFEFLEALLNVRKLEYVCCLAPHQNETMQEYWNQYPVLVTQYSVSYPTLR